MAPIGYDIGVHFERMLLKHGGSVQKLFRLAMTGTVYLNIVLLAVVWEASASELAEFLPDRRPPFCPEVRQDYNSEQGCIKPVTAGLVVAPDTRGAPSGAEFLVDGKPSDSGATDLVAEDAATGRTGTGVADELQIAATLETSQPARRLVAERRRPSRVQIIGYPLGADYLKNFYRVPLSILNAPLNWNQRQWFVASGVTAAYGLFFFLDESIRDGMKEDRNDFTDDLSRVFKPFGRGYVVMGISGAAYVVGTVAGNERLAATGVAAFQSFAIAGGITQAMKYLVGRERPTANFGSTVFRGPGLNGPRSLPSGHVTHVFALATVIATEYDETLIVPALAYGIASLTAFSRLNDDKHWMTDVLLGAGIGYAVGKVTHRLSPYLHDSPLTAVPSFDGEMVGVRVGLRL